MAGYKFLIDTNVVIGLEDDKTVDASVADLIRLCSECGVGVFVDGANYDDIRRDKNETRRAVTLSKLEKFRRLHDVPQPSAEVSVQQFGPANSANDQSDVRLLVALTAKAVDFVITQDGGLLKRAGRAGLAKNVLTVEDALGWLRQTYKTVRVVLPDLVEVKAYQIDRSASIFESLRADYDGFDKWFDRCCGEHRDCWLLKIGDHLAGLVVRKDENHAEAQTKHLGPRILKVSTFKVDDKYRGEKFGELLLKQIFWFAQRNRYDLIYLTVFPKHTYLVELLSYYGFEHTLTKSNGEYVMERPMWLGAQPVEVPSAIEFARKSYPRILDGQDARKFCIPIRPDYHRRLFPEIAFVADTPLFPARAFDLRHSPGPERKPGNTIRKVYLCRANSGRLRPGDLLFFYMSKDEDYADSQSITTVGVVEQISRVETVDDLVRWTAKRSVFSKSELESMVQASSSPVVVIDFLLVGHLESHVSLQDLLRDGVFKGAPPQSILELDGRRYAPLRARINLGFDFH